MLRRYGLLTTLGFALPRKVLSSLKKNQPEMFGRESVGLDAVIHSLLALGVRFIQLCEAISVTDDVDGVPS